MRQTLIFLRKEFSGGLKSKRLLIALAVFIIVGILSPLLAKLLPDILNGSLIEGMKVTMPEPTSYDSWTQYFKNLNSIGLLVFVIIFSDIICAEVERGSLINLITKGLARKNIVLAKFIYLCLAWTIVLIISFVIAYFYTSFYFKDSLSFNQLQTIGIYWIFGLLVNAIIIFGSTICKNIYQTLLVVIIFYLAGTGLSFISSLTKFNPLSLSSKSLEFIANKSDFVTFVPAIIVSVILTIVLVGVAIVHFNKKAI